MKNQQLSDIVREAKKGSQRATTALYEQTKNYAYYVASQYLGENDIADALQESYISVFQSLKTFDDSRDFTPWLHSIVKNKCLDLLKKGNRLLLSSDDSKFDAEDDEPLPLDLLEREEKRRDVLNIIAALPVGRRTVITLFYLEGMGISQIAAELSVTEGTVKKQLHEARQTIREAVFTEERERDNKLYGADAVPFLTRFFQRELEGGGYSMPQELSARILSEVIKNTAAGGVGGASIMSKFMSLSTGAKSAVAAVAALILIGAVATPMYMNHKKQEAQQAAIVLQQQELAEQKAEEARKAEEAKKAEEARLAAPVELANTELAQMICQALGKETLTTADAESIRQMTVVGGKHVVLNDKYEYELSYERVETRVNKPDGTYTVRTRDGAINGATILGDEEVTYNQRGAIGSLEDIAKFINLDKLAVVYTDIGDVAGLGELIKNSSLTKVYLSATNVDDSFMKQLSELPAITELSLSQTQITDFSPLGKMKDIKKLELENNGLTDIAFLAGLTGLETLNIDNNDVADISAISGMSKMKDFRGQANTFPDLLPLANKPDLESVDAYSFVASFDDLSPIADCTKLEYFQICKSTASDLSFVANMPSLESFYIWEAPNVSDLSSFAACTKLTRIGVCNSQVSDLSPLAEAVDVETITFSGCKNLTNIDALAKMTKVKTLYIFTTEVSDISVMANMPLLEKVNVGMTKVSDLSPLANAVHMKDLRVYNTAVTDLSVMHNMTELEHVDIWNLPWGIDRSPVAHVPDVAG